MGHETTRADGGQGKPEAVHDRIDGMQPQKQANHRRGKCPDKGKAPVYAQDRKAGLC